MNKSNYLEKYRRCLYEYIDTTGSKLDEADPAMGADPAAMGGAPADPNAAMGVDPNAAMGGAPADPNAAMGADPNAAMGGAPADPNGGAMGFNPQPAADPNAAMGGAPADPNAAMGGAPADPNAAMGGAPADPNAAAPAEGEMAQMAEAPVEDDKTKEIEDKIDALTSKFDKLMGSLDALESQISRNEEHMASLKADMEKRNPTPEEKLTLRSRNYSAPFSQPTDEYWDEKEATSNYSTDDDNNGEDMPEYQITKSDLNRFDDYSKIAKSFDDERRGMGLKDILGY